MFGPSNLELTILLALALWIIRALRHVPMGPPDHGRRKQEDPPQSPHWPTTL